MAPEVIETKNSLPLRHEVVEGMAIIEMMTGQPPYFQLRDFQCVVCILTLCISFSLLLYLPHSLILQNRTSWTMKSDMLYTLSLLCLCLSLSLPYGSLTPSTLWITWYQLQCFGQFGYYEWIFWKNSLLELTSDFGDFPSEALFLPFFIWPSLSALLWGHMMTTPLCGAKTTIERGGKMMAEVTASRCVYITHVLVDRFDIGQPQRHCDSDWNVVRGLKSTGRGVSDLGYAVMAAPHSLSSAHMQRLMLSSYFMKQSQFEIFQRKFQGKQVCSNTEWNWWKLRYFSVKMCHLGSFPSRKGKMKSFPCLKFHFQMFHFHFCWNELKSNVFQEKLGVFRSNWFSEVWSFIHSSSPDFFSSLFLSFFIWFKNCWIYFF